MKVNVFGRILEVLKEGESWAIYTLGEGKKLKSNDIVIPSHLNQAEVLVFLGDMFHESATPENPEILLVE